MLLVVIIQHMRSPVKVCTRSHIPRDGVRPVYLLFFLDSWLLFDRQQSVETTQRKQCLPVSAQSPFFVYLITEMAASCFLCIFCSEDVRCGPVSPNFQPQIRLAFQEISDREVGDTIQLCEKEVAQLADSGVCGSSSSFHNWYGE